MVISLFIDGLRLYTDSKFPLRTPPQSAVGGGRCRRGVGPIHDVGEEAEDAPLEPPLLLHVHLLQVGLEAHQELLVWVQKARALSHQLLSRRFRIIRPVSLSTAVVLIRRGTRGLVLVSNYRGRGVVFIWLLYPFLFYYSDCFLAGPLIVRELVRDCLYHVERIFRW